MADKIAASYVNVLKWRQDLKSFNNVKKQIRNFKKELQKTSATSIKFKTETEGKGASGKYKDQNAHLKEREKFLKKERSEMERNQRQEARWQQERKYRLQEVNDFLYQRNGAAASYSKQMKVDTIEQLKQAKNAREFTAIKRKHYALMKRETQEHNRQLNAMRKKNQLQKRMSGSLLQMGGGLVSAYTVVEGLQAVVRTGMNFEAVNKTLLAVSANSEDAKDNFKFVRAEAMRLGMDLTQAGKGYARLLASRGEMSVEDTRSVFSAVSEMGTVLGLSQDDMAGTTRA